MGYRKRIIAGLLMTATAVALCGCQSGRNTDVQSNQAEESEKMQQEAFTYENKTALPLWESEGDMPYYDESITGQSVSTLTPYIAAASGEGCVIICPGGGYQKVVMDKEGSEPAEALNENGISAFVLQYRIAPYTYKAIMSDVVRAVRYVRYHAEDFGVNPDKIAVMGFSAGGHLAAMELEHYHEDTQDLDEIDAVSAKADCGILCYPVISLTDPYAHKGSRESFLGDEWEDKVLQETYSAQLGVITSDISPCFIWHCKTDSGVPYQNSELFAKAMEAAGVECVFKLYQYGGHGLGLATEKTEVCEWFPQCVEWLKGRGY